MANLMTASAAGRMSHVFAHLGAPPYRFLEYRRLRPCGSCDHCATAIVEAFYFRSADGREFKVGNVCVGKSGDRGLIDLAHRELLRVRRAAAAAKAVERKARLDAALADPATRTTLATKPHPRGFVDRRTGAPLTLLEYVEWMARHAGDTGRKAVEKLVTEALTTKEATS